MTRIVHLVCFISSLSIIFSPCPSNCDDGAKIQLDISNGDSEQNVNQKISLKLSKPDETVLHPDIKVIHLVDGNNNIDGVDANPQQRIVSVDSWSPSKADLDSAQDVYIDKENLAAVRLAWDENKEDHIAVSGVVNGNKVENGFLQKRENYGNQSDYIDIGRNITPSNNIQSGSGTPVVVEVLLVCDKEFGDIFHHDRKRILDYLTVYFWDVNLRYKTLPGSNISFRITSIIVIGSTSEQPFIEEARESDGRAEFGRILWRFAGWVYDKMPALPKFDMAIAITNTRLEWGGGLAYYRTACHVDSNSRRHWGTLIWNDDGAWGSLTVGAHEIAHSLGAPHDDDPNIPGGCDARGYIMSGGNDDLRWFFSTCSNKAMTEFVTSNEASCLRRLDETFQSPAISPDFSSVSAPTMEEQCRRRLHDPKAFIREEETNNCKIMKCWQDVGSHWLIWSLAPVDNSICLGGGRCFRGRCRKPSSLLINVVTGQYARAQNPFSHFTPVELADCNEPKEGATPLDKFVVEEPNSNGKFLLTPFSSPDATENGEKCLYTGNSEGDGVWTDRCDFNNPWQGWNTLRNRNGEFLLQHRITKRCARQVGSYLRSYANCDRNDRYMQWKWA